MLNHNNICMSVFHSVVIREKPLSKTCRIGGKFHHSTAQVQAISALSCDYESADIIIIIIYHS